MHAGAPSFTFISHAVEGLTFIQWFINSVTCIYLPDAKDQLCISNQSECSKVGLILATSLALVAAACAL